MSFDINDRYGFLRVLENELTTPIIYNDDINSGLKKYAKRLFVYFLLKDSIVVYVGRTSNLYQRLHRHKQFKDFDYVRILECNSKIELYRTEREWIEIFDPELNCLVYS